MCWSLHEKPRWEPVLPDSRRRTCSNRHLVIHRWSEYPSLHAKGDHVSSGVGGGGSIFHCIGGGNLQFDVWEQDSCDVSCEWRPLCLLYEFVYFRSWADDSMELGLHQSGGCGMGLGQVSFEVTNLTFFLPTSLMCSLFHNPVRNGCCRICWVMLECMSSLGLHFMEFSVMRLVSRWSELVVPPWFAWFAPDDAWLVVLMYHVDVHWSRTEKHVVIFFGTWFIRAVVCQYWW